MVFGGLVTGLFGSTDAEPWSVEQKDENSINKDQHIVNDNYVY